MDFRLQQLKRYLRDVGGDDQVDLFRFSLTSLRDRIEYAKYHLDETRRLMSSYTGGEGPRPGDDHRPFMTAMTQTAAHVLACLQSLHACGDICAHVVYFGLGSNLDPTPIKEQSISARTVLARIQHGSICLALRSLVDHPEFEYLDAVVNRSKHRAVISTSYIFETQDMTGVRPWHGVKLWSFERLGKSYPVRRSDEFLTSELDRQRSSLDAILAALEEYLRTEWTDQKRFHEAKGERWPIPRVDECQD